MKIIALNATSISQKSCLPDLEFNPLQIDPNLFSWNKLTVTIEQSLGYLVDRDLPSLTVDNLRLNSVSKIGFL
jgi:hypothetical protein